MLIDDNFTNIVKAVEKGRIIYAGTQKLVAFIMSVHSLHRQYPRSPLYALSRFP